MSAGFGLGTLGGPLTLRLNQDNMVNDYLIMTVVQSPLMASASDTIDCHCGCSHSTLLPSPDRYHHHCHHLLHYRLNLNLDPQLQTAPRYRSRRLRRVFEIHRIQGARTPTLFYPLQGGARLKKSDGGDTNASDIRLLAFPARLTSGRPAFAVTQPRFLA